LSSFIFTDNNEQLPEMTSSAARCVSYGRNFRILSGQYESTGAKMHRLNMIIYKCSKILDR